MDRAGTFAHKQADFKTQLVAYKNIIDKDIDSYSKLIQKSTLQNYGSEARIPTDVFLDILSRGGKRIRGALTILGYEMSGGKDQKMIIQAARAVEMIHAYFLIMDDIQDRSDIRRGGASAHKLLEQYHHDHHLSGSSEHFGIAVAMNAMGIGNHAAQVILANLDAPEGLRLKTLSILNQTAITTDHGQTGDIMNEVVAEVTQADVDKVYELKTARYTFLNPLHMGMVLAGADCSATDAITDYAIHAGKAFQITDDILGTFGSEFESGKSPMDDTREGKRTAVTVYALEHTTNGNKNFLIQMLGNEHLTSAEFNRCKDILVESGALDFAKDQAAMHVKKALESLQKEAFRWSPTGVRFLGELVSYLIDRKS